MAVAEDPRETAEWDRARHQAKVRDQYRCQYCRMNEAEWDGVDLQVHHIRPVENGGSNDLDNLVTLCNKCHCRLHNYHSEKNRLPPELLEDTNPATLTTKETRVPLSNFRDSAVDVAEFLRNNGPTKLEYIIDGTGYSRGTVQKALETLSAGNYVCRVSRGIYAYITTLQYREALARGKDDRGNYRVHVWDPGEQSELTKFEGRGPE